MRFYLDEDVDSALGQRLRDDGHDVLTTHEAGNDGKSNGEQLEFGVAENRILVTHNRWHFRRLHAQWRAAGKEHCGIIVSKQLQLNELQRRLGRLASKVDQQQARNRVFSLAEYA